ncbi:MAG: hypothetical protein WBE22_00720 [Halobacteriota archaeon]
MYAVEQGESIEDARRLAKINGSNAEFDVSSETSERDVIGFTVELLKRNLVVEEENE